MHENELTERIIGAGMEVHKRLGPGLLESIYEECLCIELDLLKIAGAPSTRVIAWIFGWRRSSLWN
jgi:GxxExxY protein